MKGRRKSKEVEDLSIAIAKHMVMEHCTVRDAAKVFLVGKSTVHRDITKVLERIIPSEEELRRNIRRVLDENKAERSIRGGLATQHLYYLKKKNKEEQEKLETKYNK